MECLLQLKKDWLVEVGRLGWVVWGAFCPRVHFWWHQVAYIHHNNIVHCDLKPNNIACIGRRLVLLDFGSALVAGVQPDVVCERTTFWYRAPELLLGAKNSNGSPVGHTFASDMWAAVIVAAEVFRAFSKLRPFPLFCEIDEESQEPVLRMLEAIADLIGDIPFRRPPELKALTADVATPLDSYKNCEHQKTLRALALKTPKGRTLATAVPGIGLGGISLLGRVLTWDSSWRPAAKAFLHSWHRL